jgi:hypothetical protein
MRATKRAVRRALTVLPGLACVAAAACNAVLDNGIATYVMADAGAEASTMDTRDAREDTFVSWCTLHESDAAFCADFDEQGWTVNDAGQLSYANNTAIVPSTTSGPGGSMSLSDASVSAPFSFEATAIAAVAVYLQVSNIFGSTARVPGQTTITFALSTSPGCTGSAAIAAFTLTGHDVHSMTTVGVGLSGPQQLRIFAQETDDAGNPRGYSTQDALQLPADGGFNQVALTIDFVVGTFVLSVTQGGQSQSTTADWSDAASWTNGASPRPIDAGTVLATGGDTVSFGQIQSGLLIERAEAGVADGGGGTECVTRIDNVWVTYQ